MLVSQVGLFCQKIHRLTSYFQPSVCLVDFIFSEQYIFLSYKQLSGWSGVFVSDIFTADFIQVRIQHFDQWDQDPKRSEVSSLKA